jgi:hypothetical protein
LGVETFADVTAVLAFFTVMVALLAATAALWLVAVG